jgi:exodeoxyribonuclease 7 large subunit
MKQKITLNKQMLNKLNSFYLFKNPNKLFEDKKVKIDYLSDRLKDIFTYNLNLQSNKAKNLIQTFNHQANLFTLEQKNHLNLINQTMEQLMKQKIKYEKEKLYYTLSKLNTLSPLKVLERGYAIVLKEDNVVLTVNELKTGDKIKIKMKDGSKNAIIE